MSGSTRQRSRASRRNGCEWRTKPTSPRPIWSEGEDRLLAQAKVPDQSFSLPELPISLLFSTTRLSSTGEKLVLYKLVRAFEHLEEQSAAPI